MAATLEDEVAELWRANAELQRRLDEAIARESTTAAVLEESLEYQTATSDVLKVISRSTFDLQAVLDTLVKTAARLCCADIAHIAIRDGDVYRPKARFAMSLELDAFVKDQTYTPGRGTMTARTLLEKRIVHVADVATDPEYAQPEAQRLGAFRSVLGVPLMRDDVVIGAIVLGRLRVEPFTDKQIELVTTFADQAVIAIENARLITETREALDQQTATAEVLRVINSSAGDLAPVFDAMLEKAMRLCEAAFGFMTVIDGERPRTVAARGVSAAYAAFRERNPTPANALIALRVRRGEPFIHTVDLKAERFYEEGEPQRRAIVDLGGARTLLAVPLMRDQAVLGAIQVYRTDVRPFSDKQIALLQSFAAQAVIAMENARLITETREALDQQTATAEVLQVINSSPGDLELVFDAMLERAMQLCGASFGGLGIWQDQRFALVAARGVPQPFADFLAANEVSPGPRSGFVRVARGDGYLQSADLADSKFYQSGEPLVTALVDLGGARTSLIVPLAKDDEVLGILNVYRQEVLPFSDKQIALLQNFAAQAVIAVENARLLTETREALEQQTATAQVLQVINSSPGHLAPVFDTMLAKAMRLCEAAFGILLVRDGDNFQTAALHGVPPALAEFLSRTARQPGKHTAVGRMLEGEDFVHFEDMRAERAYQLGDARQRAFVELGGTRTYCAVALRKDGRLVGTIGAYRQEVRPFTDKQIALLQNFAAQAVIAMENARLLTETREALEQQTATAEVLGVINSSPGNLAPVFDAMVERAVRLCEADEAAVRTFDGKLLHLVAAHGEPDVLERLRELGPSDLSRPGNMYKFLASGENVSCIDDVRETATYRERPLARARLDARNVRSWLAVALRKEDALLGVINVHRHEVRPFTDKQIALLQNFAAQAVIAMENARLLEEIRQRQQELRVTFDNMVDGVAMFDEALRLAAWNRNFQQLLDLPEEFLAERHGFDEHVRYLVERGEFGETDAETEISRLRGRLHEHYQFERTRPDRTVIEVRHNPMPDGGVVLIYSDITERKRSEAEIRAARDAAEAAYRDLKAAQASLIQAEKMASLGQLTAGIAHEIKNPLNFVNNFAGLSVELLDELKETAAPAINALGDEERAEIDETITMLTGNLEKIAEHGRRADGIVKSMLEHSRGTSGERRAVNLNELIEEALNLAYHGARAQDASFNIALERDFADAITPIELVPQDITRVCLNLIGNGFYAATKRQKQGSDPKFKPTLKVSTRDLGEAVEVQVRDNGVGIAPEIKDKLFQPFFTTKPTGEGTGLGLSISYDIITQQHGGTITVDSRVGDFTEFTVRLPRIHQTTVAAAAS